MYGPVHLFFTSRLSDALLSKIKQSPAIEKVHPRSRTGGRVSAGVEPEAPPPLPSYLQTDPAWQVSSLIPIPRGRSHPSSRSRMADLIPHPDPAWQISSFKELNVEFILEEENMLTLKAPHALPALFKPEESTADSDLKQQEENRCLLPAAACCLLPAACCLLPASDC
jgi:hypothetical protein